MLCIVPGVLLKLELAFKFEEFMYKCETAGPLEISSDNWQCSPNHRLLAGSTCSLVHHRTTSPHYQAHSPYVCYMPDSSVKLTTRDQLKILQRFRKIFYILSFVILKIVPSILIKPTKLRITLTFNLFFLNFVC